MEEIEFDETKKGLSIASMVLGIVGIILSCTGVGIICGLLALIFGGIALNKKQGIKGMAIAGIVLGIITLALWVLLFVIMISFMSMALPLASLS